MSRLSSLVRRKLAVSVSLGFVLTCTSSMVVRAESFREFRANNPELARQAARQGFRAQVREIRDTRDVSDSRSIQHNLSQNPQRFFTRTDRSFAGSAADLILHHISEISLDLKSSDRTIELPSQLFDRRDSVTVRSGDKEVTFKAGDRVTAGELVAVQQELGGKQTLKLDDLGRASSGTFSFKTLRNNADLFRITDMTIPENVEAFNRVTAHSSFAISGDLNNYGSISEVLVGRRATTTISADDITNQLGASIATRAKGGQLDLKFQTTGDFINYGSISAEGELEISAGGHVRNETSLKSNASISADSDILVRTDSLVNSGVITSRAGDFTISSSNNSNSQNINIQNSNGTITANDINLRESSYDGSGDLNIHQGNLISNRVNLNAGKGSINVDVDKLTGTVVSSGKAVHVRTQTGQLTIGDQNLCGDPTYYNTAGDIVINGNIAVGETLAIIASGNITATNAVSVISTSGAQGFDINIIAGANVTGVGADETGTIPGTAATSPVTFTGASTTGGKIDFSAANPGLLISSNSTGGDNSGGDITLAAYQQGLNGGQILLPASSNIDASGSGTGAFGDVTVVAQSSIVIGSVSHAVGAGALNISVVSNQPAISAGNSITFAPDGSISSGNKLYGDTTSFFSGSGSIKSGNLLSYGGSIAVLGGDIVLGSLDASAPTTTSNGGSVIVKSSSFQALLVGQSSDNSILSVDVSAGAISGKGGVIDISARRSAMFDQVGTMVVSAGALNYAVADGDGATLKLAAPQSLTLPSSLIEVSGAGANATGGYLRLDFRQLLYPQSDSQPLSLIANGSGIGNGGTIYLDDASFYPSGGGSATFGFAPGQLFVRAQSGLSGGDGGTLDSHISDFIIGDGGAILVNPRGANGDGGTIAIDAIRLGTAFGTHQTLSADGIGSGSGGTIRILNTQVSGVSIGKGVNQVELFAQSGESSGNGGTIDIRAQFRLLAETDAIHASPIGSFGDGANITLVSGPTNIYQIVGSLSADGVGGGDGGTITLGSSYPSSNPLFEVGAAGTTNGITGSISAKGAKNGSLSIAADGSIKQYVDIVDVDDITYLSTTGSISVLKHLGSTTSNSISLTALEEISTADLLEANSIALSSTNSSIGGSRALKLSTNNLAVSGTVVNIQNVSSSPLLTIQDSSAGGNFKVTSNSSIEVVGTITNSNSISLESTGRSDSNMVISGSISASTTDGAINLKTRNGNILNNSLMPVSLTAFQVSLESLGPAGSEAVPLRVNAKELLIKTKDDVFVNNFQTGETKLLSADSRKTFALNASGNLTVSTPLKTATSIKLATVDNNGNILFENSVGGNKSLSIIAKTHGNGSIQQTSSRQKLVANALELSSETGNIGNSTTSLVVQTASLRVNESITGGGDVYLTNIFRSAAVLSNSYANGVFNLTTKGGLLTNNILAKSIAITTGGGLLKIADSASVETTNGGISLNNQGNSKNTKIEVGLGASITTLAVLPGDGQIQIFTGKAAPQLVQGAPPANATVTTPNTVFFNNGITALSPNNTLTAKNTNLIFDTGKLKASAIQLNGDVTIVADPPSP